MKIMVHEGTCLGRPWRTYCVITDGRVAVVDMTPALFGWNLGKVTIQGADDWCGMAESSIVAFKLESGHSRLASESEIGADFMPKLLAAAGVSNA